MPSGAVYLLEGVILCPFFPSPASFPGENLDLFGRTTAAPVASFPSWRRRLGSSSGGDRLLSLESFRFCACLRLFHLHHPGCLGRRFMFAGGCFAAVLLWRMLCRRRRAGDRFGRMLCCLIGSGGCFGTMVSRVDTLQPLSIFAPLVL